MGISLVKIAIFLLIWLLLWLPLAVPLAKHLQWQPFQPLRVEQKLPLVASLYVLIPLVIWGVTTYEGFNLADYGLKLDSWLIIGLFTGLILGIAGLGLIFVLEWWLGWLKWHSENWHKLSSLGFPLLLLALWIGWTEELVFRGVFINELRQDFPIWLAATISSLIFAILHLVWERQETLPQLPGLWLMGMVLVGARLAAGGSLGLAWGLHAGWVWGLAVLDAAGLISYTGKGKTWFTGLQGHPLAGVAGLLCLLMTGIILLGLYPF